MPTILNPLTGRLENTDATPVNTSSTVLAPGSTGPNYDYMVNQAYGKIGRSGIGTEANQIDQAGYDYWLNQLRSGAIDPMDFENRFLNVAANYSGSDANKYQSAINTARNLIGMTTPVTPSTNRYGVPSSNPMSSSTNPYIAAAEATTSGNIAGAERATSANRVNQVTPYGNLEYRVTGTDANGNPIWSATQNLAPEFESAFRNIAANVTSTSSQPFNPTNLPSVGINPGETYEAAIMRRLQPLQERESKQLDAALANQGIMPGSEAYNNAKTQFAQKQNDQLTSAIVGGFNTGLAANKNAYDQALTTYQVPFSTLNNFRTGTAPSYVNPYNQPAVSGPDYLGAYTTGENANLAANAANAAGRSSVTSGLFNLAGTALANPSAVRSAYNTVTGLFS